jgi:riboflavin biosynthesis pyrimidine reductase
MRRLLPETGDVSGAAALEAEYELGPVPHLRANFVTSLDGMIELDGHSGPLAGPADQELFMAMRAVTDVILVGAGTVRQEKYGPVRLDPAAQDRRRARGQSDLPPIAVVSNRADLDPEARLFGGSARPLVITTTAGAEANPRLAEVAEVILCGDQFVDVRVVNDVLLARGFQRVLCEGGPTLLRTLLGADLLDELCLSIAATLAGADHRSLLGDQPLSGAVPFTLSRLLEADGMLFASYERRRCS